MAEGLRELIVDTDPGIDDAMALLFLQALRSVRIVAITTVFGNADVGITTRNARYLAGRFGIAAPVHRGASQPLRIARRPSPIHVHGHDGLGDAGALPDVAPAALTPAPTPAAMPAHQRIVELLRERPGRVSILALGPLTNLALALRQDPGIAELAESVVVMGGAFGWSGRRGNVSPVAEANVRNDPDAADEVLGARWPVTVVGLDVTSHCVLPQQRALALAERGGDAGRFLWDISRGYEAIYREHDGLDGCCLHDVAAAACLVQPDLFATQRGPVRVVTEGIAIGQTIQQPAAARFPGGDWDHAPSQQACHAVNAAGVLELYSSSILAHGLSTATPVPARRG
jgi:inosine-uridine nucleoside N-ribohydrolase